ncbi:MAG: hypothetical protein H6862_02740 [Rhodospirillales bacterium]|nr:hypothetical protein [Rhodospirillales bacterium]
MPLFVDRKSRVPRLWSNAQLARFASLFDGDVVNVSAWKDSDKDGRTYRSYFTNCRSYALTNYKTEAMGFQGAENEIFLDLTAPLPDDLNRRYDVVFNHTALEHIFEVETAFANLCRMSSDIVITVVPFVQQMHSDYGDYWRFTPTCIQKLFEKNGLKVLYSSFNSHVDSSVYVFTIAARAPEKWAGRIPGNLTADGTVNCFEKTWLTDSFPPMVGSNAVLNLGGHVGFWLSKGIAAVKSWKKT